MSLHYEKHYEKIFKKYIENRKYLTLLPILLANIKCRQYLTEERGQRDIRRICNNKLEDKISYYTHITYMC